MLRGLRHPQLLEAKPPKRTGAWAPAPHTAARAGSWAFSSLMIRPWRVWKWWGFEWDLCFLPKARPSTWLNTQSFSEKPENFLLATNPSRRKPQKPSPRLVGVLAPPCSDSLSSKPPEFFNQKIASLHILVACEECDVSWHAACVVWVQFINCEAMLQPIAHLVT